MPTSLSICAKLIILTDLTKKNKKSDFLFSPKRKRQLGSKKLIVIQTFSCDFEFPEICFQKEHFRRLLKRFGSFFDVKLNWLQKWKALRRRKILWNMFLSMPDMGKRRIFRYKIFPCYGSQKHVFFCIWKFLMNSKSSSGNIPRTTRSLLCT